MKSYYKTILLISSIAVVLQTGLQAVANLQYGLEIEFIHIVFWLLVVAWSGGNILLDFIVNKYKNRKL
jgi:hypothetical protein